MEKRLMGMALSLAAASALATSSLAVAPVAVFATEGGAGDVGENRAVEADPAGETLLPHAEAVSDGAIEGGAGDVGENRALEADPAGETLLAHAEAVSGSVIKGDGWMLDGDGILTIEKDIPKPSDFRYEWGRWAEQIREVRLAEGVTVIPNAAFASSSSGANPIVYSNLTKFTACSTLKTIGWNVFSGTRSLSEVHLNDGLEAVNHSAFANTGITSIVLPNNVTWGGDCFTGCSQLGGTLVIPGGSKFEDGHNATFYGIGVDTVVIEDGVTWIPNSAFNGCANLRRVYLPRSVVQIGGDTHETAPGIYYASFDPCMIFGYKGTAAEQYVDHWLKVNPEANRGLSFHAIDGEEHEPGSQETPGTGSAKADAAIGSLPATGDPVSLLGFAAISGVAAVVAGEAQRRKR